MHTTFRLKNLKERDHSEHLGGGWEDNIRMDLREVVNCRFNSSGSGYGPMAGPSEHDNETSGSIKGGQFLD
jgi:hypothetical protein